MTLDDDIHRHQWAIAQDFHAALTSAILLREATDPGLHVSNVNGWHSTADLLAWRDAPVSRLLRRIRTDGRAAGAAGMRVEAWANVMRRGAFHVAHRHGQAAWSGVYYVDAGGNCGGEITFARGMESVRVTPRTGLMLVFPGDLLHSVAAYADSGTRISVGFNFFCGTSLRTFRSGTPARQPDSRARSRRAPR